MSAPVTEAGGEEDALGGLILQAAQLQLDLFRAERLFARGAITLGALYMRGGVTFGAALVEAYRLESSHARYPRVILSPAASASQRDALRYYAVPEESPEDLFLITDDTGDTFVNYLGLLLDDPSADARPSFAIHRDVVSDKLDEHRGDAFWEKYRWVADYHNTVCARYFPNDSELRVSDERRAPRFPPFAERSA